MGRAFVGEAEAANLRSRKASVGTLEERHFRHAEHADLGIEVAQVWNLENLFDALEAVVLACAKFPLRRIERMATVPGERRRPQNQADARHVEAVGGGREI